MNAMDTVEIKSVLSDIQVYSDVIRNTDMSPDEARSAGNGTLHEIQGYPVGSGNENLRSYIFTDSLYAVLLRLLALVWPVGSVAAGIWFMTLNTLLLTKIRKTRVLFTVSNCSLPVYVTRAVASPCLFGVLRPAIYLTPKAAADVMQITIITRNRLEIICGY
jgi:hypothetical protein